ncbi:alpha/beta fold hydrolase [Edaphobacter modestus]|uniref:Pimeloyl-ACP methyl ester carboxylesterase n=1 Tax=Edaphobacter modestus TaxID=388466 RepID=A0A4Q7YFL6_9BACT|nr:alpha/beta hydrolase [Edaphobacter modestus]RZU35564.1 pimeloyl-ACP methyl ester carboxylesterase [Edaphobacter modestus]
MLSITSALLGIALIWPPTASNVSSAPAWETLPAEQPLSVAMEAGYVDHDGVRIWYGTAGKGDPVVLLHGGMESSLSWGNQVPALIKTHHRVILIDSRGHGRSTLGPYPLSYEKMQSDVVAVMDTLHLKKAAFVGWSDGAIISLIMAMKNPERVNRVYAFGANMNTDAVVSGAFTSPILSEVATRLAKDYARISPTPDEFGSLHKALETMQKKEPNYTTKELAAIKVSKIAIADGDHEEFITRAHTAYLAATIPGAKLIILPNVSHFAPWQDSTTFNNSVIRFLDN